MMMSNVISENKLFKLTQEPTSQVPACEITKWKFIRKQTLV